jgi:ketosteroid isomerase-like protein
VLHCAAMRRMGIGLAVLAVACAGALAGCGGDDDDGTDTAAGRAAQEYVDAYNDRDFEAVCSMLTASYKDELQFGPTGCPQYFDEHTTGAPTTLTLVEVEENGSVATAKVRSESEDASGEVELTVALARQPDGSWQVNDLTGSSALP